MLKTKWHRHCLDHRHHIVRGERIRFLIYEGDSRNDNQLICDNCGERKSWKAITVNNTVWCDDCLLPYDEVYWLVKFASKTSNSNEEIEKALWKEFVRQCDADMNNYFF